MRRKRTQTCLSCHKEIQSRSCLNCRLTKPKYFADLVGKTRFELQVTHMCEFHFNITDINVSAGRHRKTLKPKSLK